MRTATSREETSQRVRPSIARSWHRSALCGVDREIGFLFQDPSGVDPDAEILGVAEPVLRQLRTSLAGASASVGLSDEKARMLHFQQSSRRLQSLFEDLGARPGARAAEELVGTNAVGTALEEGRSVQVSGDEHYQRSFFRISCAAAIVRHPLTQRVVGAVDVTLADQPDNPLLLPLAVKAADDIQARMLDRSSAADRAVLEQLKRRGGGSARAVLGLSRATMMANDPAIRLLSALDQPIVWEIALETMDFGRERHVDVATITADTPVRVHCVPVTDGGVVLGALLDFGTPETAMRRPRFGSLSGANAAAPTPAGSGLVGTSAEARALFERIGVAVGAENAALVSGEPGAGKTEVARAVLAMRFPDSVATVFRCSELDPTEVITRARLYPTILTHVESAEPAAAHRLADALRQGELDPRRVLGTVDASAIPVYPWSTHALMDELAQIRLEVPPLRNRRDDILALSTHFAHECGMHPRRFHPEVHQLMLRYAWPGNCRELRSVVSDACTTAATAGATAVRLEHVAIEVRRRAFRRPLNPLEQAEAEAILAALRACGQNKVQAAALLQISRPRLYRKMRAYGLDGAALS